MSIDPAEVGYRAELWWVVKELQKNRLIYRGDLFRFTLVDRSGAPDFMQQRAIVDSLLEDKVLDSAEFFSIGKGSLFYMISANPKKFTELYGSLVGDFDSVEVTLLKRDVKLFLMYDNESHSYISMKPGRKTESLMNAFFEHGPSARVALSRLTKIDSDLEGLTDIGETLRKMGFSKEAKEKFFPGCGAKSTGFQPNTIMTRQELGAILDYRVKTAPRA